MANVSKNAEKRRFEMPLEGGQTAFIDYVETDDGINLTHTEVPSEHEGKGVGGRLVKGAVELARQEGHKVDASCSFAAGYLKKHPE